MGPPRRPSSPDESKRSYRKDRLGRARNPEERSDQRRERRDSDAPQVPRHEPSRTQPNRTDQYSDDEDARDADRRYPHTGSGRDSNENVNRRHPQPGAGRASNDDIADRHTARDHAARARESSENYDPQDTARDLPVRPHNRSGTSTHQERSREIPGHIRESQEALALEAQDNITPLVRGSTQTRHSFSQSARTSAEPLNSTQTTMADIVSDLNTLLAKFIMFGLTQYDSCLTFCQNSPSIWGLSKDTVGAQLLEAAKRFARAGLKDAADRAIQRLGMLLPKRWAPAQLEEYSGLEILRFTASQTNNGTQLRTLLTRWCDDTRKRILQANDRESQANERESNAAEVGTQGSRESRERALSRMSDFDTIIPTSGGTVRETSVTVGGSVPDLGEGLSSSQRAELADFMKGFKLIVGTSRINEVFGLGNMISVFWHENFGSSLPDHLREKIKLGNGDKEPGVGKHGPGFVTLTKNNTVVFSHIKRFIIVAQRHGYSVAVPVTSYNGQGLQRKVIPEVEQLAHSIVYSRGNHPIHLKSEPKFTKTPICVDMRVGALNSASRLNFGKPFSIEHNIQVKHLGSVVRRDVPALVSNYLNEVRASLGIR